MSLTRFTHARIVVAGALVAAGAAWTSVPAATASTPSVWDQIGGSGTHQGSSPAMTGLTTSTVPRLASRWASAAGGQIWTSPIVRNARVYTVTHGATVAAFDESSGARLWAVTVSAPVPQAPATDGARVYAVTSDCTVYALSAMTGALVWKVRTDSTCTGFAGGVLVAGGKLFVGSQAGVLYAYAAATGVRSWYARQANANGWGSPALAGSLVISNWDNNTVTAVSASTGARAWTHTTPAQPRSTPSYTNGVVYVGDDLGGVSALTASTGAARWRRALASAATTPVVRSAPAVADGLVFVNLAQQDQASGGGVIALNQSTGARVWSFASGYSTGSAAVANGIVYTNSRNGYLYALRATTGTKLWSSAVPGASISSPALGDNAVFLGGNDGNLRAFALPGATLPTSGSTAPASPSGQPMPTGNPSGWRMVFSDDFPGTSVNSSKWGLYSGVPGSDPHSMWAPSHVKVIGGLLDISCYRDPAYNNVWTGGGVNNSRAVSFAAGRYELRMRRDKAAGVSGTGLLWPANDSWPPELDFVEDRDGNASDYTTTIHYSLDGQHLMIHRTNSTDLTKWHTYGVQWNSSQVVYTIDGTTWATVSTPYAPRIAMALAIQVNAVPDSSVPPNSTTPPVSHLQVDWVVGYVPA